MLVRIVIVRVNIPGSGRTTDTSRLNLPPSRNASPSRHEADQLTELPTDTQSAVASWRQTPCRFSHEMFVAARAPPGSGEGGMRTANVMEKEAD
jgi:hypothetical protein